jgi:hypothetical protein
MNNNFLAVLNSIKESGGATYHMQTGELNPNSGYIVALHGFEKTFEFHPNPNIFQEQVLSYLTKDILDQIYDRADIYLGFWLHEGKIYFDIVEKIDNLNTAIFEGRRNKQKAIRDCANKKDIFLSAEISADPDIQTDKKY